MRIATLISLLLCFSNGLCQERYHATYYFTKDGLPSNMIRRCTKDDQGFLWVSTQKGLYKYDGIRFTPGQEVNGNVLSLCSGSDGMLYVFPNNAKLVSFSPTTRETKTIMSGSFNNTDPDDDHYNNLFETENKVWSVDFTHVKYYDLKTNASKHYQLREKVGDWGDRFAQFASPTPGSVWVASRVGLDIWNQKTDTIESSFNTQLKKIAYAAILKISADTLALASDNAVYLVKASTQSIFKYVALRLDKGENIQSLAIRHRTNQLLVATDWAVYALDVHQHARPIFLNREIGARVQSISTFADEDIVWVCTEHGLIKLAPTMGNVTNVSIPQHLATDVSITAIAKGEEDFFYVGTLANGLFRTNWKQWQNLSFPSAASINHILHFNNQLLLSCDDGLHHWADGRWRKIKFSSDNSTEQAVVKTIRDSGRIWVLPKSKPVAVLDESSLAKAKDIVLDNDALFSDKNIWNDIAADSLHQIYLAGWMPIGFGMAKYSADKKRFVQLAELNHRSLFTSDYFNAIAFSKRYPVLFSAYGGLNGIDTNGKITLRIGKEDQPLLEGKLAAMAELNDKVWINTDHGIQVCDPQTKNIYSLPAFDDLPSDLYFQCFEKISDSLLVLAIQNRIALVDPTKITRSEKIPTLVLSDLYVNGVLKPNQTSFVLSPAERNITLHFSSLQYEPNQHATYQFRINNQPWQDLGTQPRITLAGFEPSTYKIDVRALNELENWETENLTLTIVAQAHFYENNYFFAAVISLALLVVFVFVYFRIREQQRRHNFRFQLSQDLHDDVGATLSSVQILTQLISQKENLTDKGAIYLKRMIDDVREMQLKLYAIIWSVKSTDGQLPQVLNLLSEYAVFYFEAKQIEFSLTTNIKTPTANLPIPILRAMYLIGKEALNNVAKHSQATKTYLHVEVDTQKILMTIYDNGIGIGPNQKSHNNGIAGMARRAKDIRAHLHIEPNEPTGTKIILSIPFP